MSYDEINVGETFLCHDGARWNFHVYNDVADDVTTFDRNGEAVTARELIAGQAYQHIRPAHPLTPIELKTQRELGRPYGTAQSWPRDADGPADVWEVFDYDPELRRIWLVHSGLYWENTGRMRWDEGHYDPDGDRLAVVHIEHVSALPRLTLWEIHDQEAIGLTTRDNEGRWL
ncbi:hypothetical protein ABCR94_00595 [Streptomyces sp. 21So2-11]|uniref:hypothetical protein n=1 Tax=Streptomyces sp. 21So2-11 TaxID=3144408 RepID=UPI00321A03E0